MSHISEYEVDYNPEFYQIPCDASFKKEYYMSPTYIKDYYASPSAIDKRLSYFASLQDNIWFDVMNWVLDQLKLKDPLDRRRHLWGHCFYFNWKKLKHPVYNYNKLW